MQFLDYSEPNHTVCVLPQPFASTFPAGCLPFAISLLVSLWPEYFRKRHLKKKKKKGGWGRQAKPFELLPVLSKVPRGRVEGAGPQKILRLCLALRLVSNPLHLPLLLIL